MQDMALQSMFTKFEFGECCAKVPHHRDCNQSYNDVNLTISKFVIYLSGDRYGSCHNELWSGIRVVQSKFELKQASRLDQSRL